MALPDVCEHFAGEGEALVPFHLRELLRVLFIGVRSAAERYGFIEGTRDSTDDPAREVHECSSCVITGILHRVTLMMSGVYTTCTGSASSPAEMMFSSSFTASE